MLFNLWRNLSRQSNHRVPDQTCARRRRLCLERLEERTLLNAGGLDSTFGSGGEVATPFPGAERADTRAVLIQPDGKIVAAGTVRTATQVEIGLVRYNADGSLDATFGTGGLVTTPVDSVNTFGASGAERVVLQPDGKILAIGSKLARYTSSGILDASFGTGGLVSVSGVDLTLLPDGKILAIAGSGLARFNSDGSPDTTFGTGGQVSLDNPEMRIALLPDGQFLLGGGAGVLRYNPDGSRDVSFPGGNVGFPIWDMALQADGRILAVGSITEPTTGENFAVRRLNVNGSSDVTFGSGGVVTTPLPSGGLATAVLPQSDDKIVAIGTTSAAGASSIALVRYDPNGSLDTTFGSGGETLTGGVNFATGFGALQPDGKIVAVASVFSASPPEFLAARYTADPPITDPNQKFLTQVYLDLLQRPLDPAGLSVWSNALNSGATRTQVAAAIETSQEYHAVEVQKLYGLLLERTAEPAGLNIWVSFLDQGGTFEQMEAMILGSDEYFAGHGGGTNDGFLKALYADVLYRPTDPGSQSWSQALASGTSRTSVAVGVLGSMESDTDEVQAIYRLLLRRAADSSGLHAFTQALQQGVANEAIIALIAGSDEYFGRL